MDVRKRKREIRIQIMNLQDTHCEGCDKVTRDKKGNVDVKWCTENCDVGKRVFELGEQLGVEGDRANFKRTTEQWDVVCNKAAAMLDAGVDHNEVTKQLGVSWWKALRNRMKERGLYPRESAKQVDNINTPERPIEPLRTESGQSDDELEGGGTKLTEIKRKRTAEEWDEICKKAIEMREAGVSPGRMYGELGVQSNNLYAQLQKRGLQLPELVRKAIVKPPGVNVSPEPKESFPSESEVSNDVLEQFKEQLQTKLDALKQENATLKEQLQQAQELNHEYADNYTTLQYEVARLEEALQDTQSRLHWKEELVVKITRGHNDLETKYQKVSEVLMMLLKEDIA